MRNALDHETITLLDAAIRDADSRPDVRSVVILGAEGTFSSGADLAELQSLGTLDGARAWASHAHHLLDSIERCGKPVLAAVEGYAVAGGQELALACDLRIASETAMFGQTELRVGSIAAWGGTQRLTRIVGPSRAKELIYGMRLLSGVEALSIGLVNEVWPSDALLASVESWCERLAMLPPGALAASKASINRALDLPLEQNLALDAESFALQVLGVELKEGVRAFIEKRQPSFGGPQ